MEYVKDPELDLQRVNMANYLLADPDADPTPYLCPSTLDPFQVDFNLNAKIGMNVEFFRGEYEGEMENAEPDLLTGNDVIKDYFLNIAKLKSERKVADFVREYEMDGDSTYSSQSAKDSLFSKYFAEFLETAATDKPLTDANTNSLSSLDKDQEKNFSEDKRFETLFKANPGEMVAKEMELEDNLKSIENISYVYNTEIVKIDTVSVRISSPINANSVFKGYDRNILQKKFLFGIQDDEYAGNVDNGTTSWKDQ